MHWPRQVEATLSVQEQTALELSTRTLADIQADPFAYPMKAITETISIRSELVCRVIDRAGITCYEAADPDVLRGGEALA